MALYQKYKTGGFVFREENNLGADKTFSIFTKEFGRVEVLGRAIRKIDSKLRGGIEIFSLSEIEFVQGKNRKTLTDAVFRERFKDIFNNREKLEVAHKISQLIDGFVKGEEKDERIFSLLSETFNKLDNYQLSITNYQLLYGYFFWNFISILGYAPELSNCANCSQRLNPYGLYFSNKEGGVICKNCQMFKKDGVKIKSDIIKILRLILKKDWNTLSRLKVENSMHETLKKVSDNYYPYLADTNIGYSNNRN